MSFESLGLLHNREKQEIKTVRIVKRESERRQRDRGDRTGNIGIPLTNGLQAPGGAKRLSDDDVAGTQKFEVRRGVNDRDFTQIFVLPINRRFLDSCYSHIPRDFRKPSWVKSLKKHRSFTLKVPYTWPSSTTYNSKEACLFHEDLVVSDISRVFIMFLLLHHLAATACMLLERSWCEDTKLR